MRKNRCNKLLTGQHLQMYTLCLKNRSRKLMLKNQCNGKNKTSSDWSTVDVALIIAVHYVRYGMSIVSDWMFSYSRCCIYYPTLAPGGYSWIVYIARLCKSPECVTAEVIQNTETPSVRSQYSLHIYNKQRRYSLRCKEGFFVGLWTMARWTHWWG